MLPLLHSNYKREEIITCKNEVVNWMRYSSVNVVFPFAQRTSPKNQTSTFSYKLGRPKTT